MNLLLLSPTPFEIVPLIQHLEKAFQKEGGLCFRKEGLEVEVRVSGVGGVSTTYHLLRALVERPRDLVLLGGIAGAIDRRLEIGGVYNVVSEQFGDLGAEMADGSFSSVFDLRLMEPSAPPFREGVLHNPYAEEQTFLPPVHGLSVNRVTGRPESLEALTRNRPLQPQLESMEGAAFFFTCLQEGVHFLQIRAVSNYVETRKRESWDIPGAITRLNDVLIELIHDLKKGK